MKAIALSFALASGWLLSTTPAKAQVIPDGTVNTVVTPSGNTFTIDGGTTAGSNLFHSFSEFSLPTGSEAFFNNGVGIDNILSRVTGSNISNIDGLIRANGTANLFLLNPNGIVFGPNASLDIGGSFVSTTAETVQFADGIEFSSTDTSSNPLLSVSVPVGLQFGQNPGDIVDLATSLEVPADNTLALLGSTIALENATLTSPSGRIEMGSVGANQTVSLTPVPEGFAFGYDGISNFQDIALGENSLVQVSGTPGGTIRMVARNISLQPGTIVHSVSDGSEVGGPISLQATESIEMVGTGNFLDEFFSLGPPNNLDDPNTLVAGVYSAARGTGTGSPIEIAAGNLNVRDSVYIQSVSILGRAGDISFDVEDTFEYSAGQSSSITRDTSIGGSGNIAIDTRRLVFRGAGSVGTGTFVDAPGGNLTVNATESIEVNGTDFIPIIFRGNPEAIVSGILADSFGGGNTGDITINTGRLSLIDGGGVAIAATSGGRPGNITVNADRVELLGRTPDPERAFPSSIVTIVRQQSPGGNGGGNITVVADELIAVDGGGLFIDNFAPGDGGTIDVTANSIRFENGSEIGAETAFGSGSNVRLNAERLSLDSSSQIRTQIGFVQRRASETLGTPGSGGNIAIDVDRLDISGDSNIFSFATIDPSLGSSATLTGGNIALSVDRLRLEDGGRIFSSNLAPGTGGNLTLAVGMLRLDHSQISSETAFGEGANIAIGGRQLFLRDGSQITTTVGAATDPASGEVTIGMGGSGGNIAIDVGPLVAINNSDIFTDVLSGSGGQINIDARAIVGLRFRDELTRFSDIATISTFDEGDAVTLSCGDDRDTEIASKTSNVASSPTLEEATEWFVGDDGSVTLTANRSTTTSPSCQ